MRDSPCKRSDGFHLLRLAQAVFHVTVFGDVAKHANHSDDFSGGVSLWRLRSQQMMRLSVQDDIVFESLAGSCLNHFAVLRRDPLCRLRIN